MLAFPASAEPNPKAGPSSTPSAPNAESTGTTPPADTKPEEARLDAATSEGNLEEPSSNGATGETRPEEADPSSDAAVIEAPKSSILIDVDKATQEMTVFVDGVELYTWPVSTGIRGYTTPSGTFATTSMNEIWYSKQWDNAPMPHAVFFTKKGHAIHGTLEKNKLGNAASHGCIRLSTENAATLFELVKATGLENTQVVLTGVTKGGEGPKVATTGSRKPQAYPPWFEPGNGFYVKPGQRNKKRRGLFGRRWFQPETQGYYAPRNYPRAVGPRY